MADEYGGGGFLFGGNTGYTPETLAGARLKLAQAMMQQGLSTEPIRSPWQGAAHMLEAALGGYDMYRMQQEQNASYQPILDALNGGSQGGGNAFPPAPAPPAPPAQQGDSSASAPSDGSQPAPTPDASGASQTADISGDHQTFINSLMPTAIEVGKQTGVDPRIIVAQAANETGYGQHAPGNNYFGIKSHGQAGGNSLMTTEYGADGQPHQEMASFRGYASPADSVRGYGQFILSNPRYAAFRNAQGMDAQLSALQASGYATSPHYGRDVGAIARGIQLPQQTAGAGGTQVASLDPSAGMGGMPSPPNMTPPEAPGPATPQPGYVDPTVSAPNYVPPQAVPQQAPQGDPGPSSQSGPFPVPESAYQGPQGGSLAAAAINAQAPIDPTQTASISPQDAPQLPPAQNVAANPVPPQQMSAQFQAGAPWDNPPSPQQKLAQAAQGLPPQQNANMQSPQFRALVGVLMNPYASPGAKQMAGQLIQQQMMPQYDFVTRPDGEVDYVNKRNPALSGMALPARHLPTYGPIGKDPVTGFEKYGWINPVTREIVPGPDQNTGSMVPPVNPDTAPQQAAPQPAAPQQQAIPTNAPQQAQAQAAAPQQDSATNITVPKVPGETYLDKLSGDPQWAPYVAQARAVLRGDMPLPVGNAATKPTDQVVLRLVMAADPQFNGSVAAARGAAIKDFTNGDNPNSSGGQVLSVNTALAHMREAARASEVLGKQQVQFEGAPGGSSVANTLQEKLSPNSSAYHTALTKYNAIVTPMAEELTKFYSGAAGTQSSRDAMEEVLNPNSTPEQRRGAFQILIGGLQGKTDELQRKWHQAMGPGSQDFPIIGPEGKMGINYVNNLGKNLSDTEQSLQNARDAIIGGAPREAVVKKLQDAKIDPARL